MQTLKTIIIKAGFFLLLIPLFTACQKDDNTGAPGNSQTAGHIPGMGKEPGDLEGTAFKTPDNIGLTMLKVTDDNASSYCRVTGSGIFVMVSFQLENHSGKDTTLTLPAGLTFHSMDDEVQNGLLLQDVKIPVQQNDVCKTLLYLYCVNETRHASDQYSAYSIGPVTNAAPLKELIDMLKDKNISVNINSYNTDDLAIISELQDIVWDITNNDGLTQQDIAYIHSLN